MDILGPNATYYTYKYKCLLYTILKHTDHSKVQQVWMGKNCQFSELFWLSKCVCRMG